MFFFRTLRSLVYLLFSRHRKGHGIHSPFIFDLVSKTFRNKINPDIVCKIEGIRKKNLGDNRIINVLDPGAGSVKMKGSLRRVSAIAKYSSIPKKYGILLSNMAAEFGKPAIIELGTSVGIGSLYLSAGAPDVPVFTIEGSPRISEIASENITAAGSPDIRLMNGSFDDMLGELSDEKIKPGLVFIDGDHRRSSTLRYFSTLAGISDDKTAIIIDDIHLSPEMEEAWNEIRKADNVSVTVDLGRLGIVFFRKRISRFDYVIRY